MFTSTSASQGASTELAVFDARLYIRVRRVDEPAKSCGVRGCSGSQFDMAHELASALQQAGRIRQRCTMKEPHVDVRGEYIDIAEGRISQTCNRTAVMQKLPDFVPALSHHLKPLMRDGFQFACMRFHPRIDGGIPLDSAVESQQFRSHRRSTFFFRELRLRSLHEKDTGLSCLEERKGYFLSNAVAFTDSERLVGFSPAIDRSHMDC